MSIPKCPNCQADIGPTGKCEYCGTRINSTQSTNNAAGGTNSFQMSLEQINEKLRKLKLFPKPTLMENFFRILISVLTLGLYPAIKKRIGKNYSFKGIELELRDEIKKVKTYYSGNLEVDKIIVDTEKELEEIKNEYFSSSKKANIGCLVFLVVFILITIFVLTNSSSDESLSQDEEMSSVIGKIDDNINQGQFDIAKSLTENLDLDTKKEYLRKIQFAEVFNVLKGIQSKSNSGKKYEALEDLKKLSWKPIDNPEFNYKEKEALKRFNFIKDSIMTTLNK